MESIVQGVMAKMERSDVLTRTGAVDGLYTLPEGARFRFNVFRRQGTWCIAFRQLEDRFRSLEELGLPTTLYRFCELRDGLVLIGGPAGAGKTTTMGTLIDRINHKRKARIITIEAPSSTFTRPS
jgi:twitching motility protein PilT